MAAPGLLHFESRLDHLGGDLEAACSPPRKMVGSREVVSSLTPPHSWKSFRPGPAPVLGGFCCHQPSVDLDPADCQCLPLAYLVHREAVPEGRTFLAPWVQEERERRKTKDSGSWVLWEWHVTVGAGAALPQP